jgi:hypothetical protein
MTSFKTWLSEIALSSDGVTDNQPVQTAKTAIDVANDALGSPDNRDDISSISQITNRNQARDVVNQLALKQIDQTRPGIDTNVGQVAPQIALQLRRPELFPNFRRAAMKKKMKKAMKKK